jgi:predicted ATP-grasp superfamily ATP-dependent carboligase
MKSVPSDIPPPMIQGYVPGRGVGVNMLIAPGGALCAEFAYERMRDVRPTGAGSVLRRSIPMQEQLREMSVQLLRKLNWWGVAMVEFRVDDTIGCPYLMEINGRFWGSLQLAIDAGVNFPRLLLDVARGKPVRCDSYKAGVVSRWWLGDFRRTLRVLRGRPDGYTGDFPGRLAGLRELFGNQPPGTLNQVFRWNDPLPAIAEIVALARRLS